MHAILAQATQCWVGVCDGRKSGPGRGFASIHGEAAGFEIERQPSCHRNAPRVLSREFLHFLCILFDRASEEHLEIDHKSD